MAEIEEYKVDKELCIDCNACYTSFPEIFKQVPWQGETKAEAYAPTEKGKLNPWDVLGVCPTDAISKIGEMPPKPEKAAGAEDALPPLEDLGPWEARWERVKGQQESKWDVMKRYGMAAILQDTGPTYIVKMEFPERTPLNILTYQMGLPDAMPDYKYDVAVDEASHKSLVINARLEDGHIKQLCGKINSFPDRFRRTFAFPERVDVIRKSYRNKVLVVELKKITDAVLN